MPSGLDRPCYPVLSQIFDLRHIMILTPRAGRRHDIAVPISALDRMMEKYGLLVLSGHVVLHRGLASRWKRFFRVMD